MIEMKGNGILLVNKAAGSTSFRLVHLLRKKTKIQTIGHAGTLDPFATGVMVLLLGRDYTRLSNQFLNADKEYRALVELGKTTDTYDIDGTITSTSSLCPSVDQIQTALLSFQGQILQVPPMFSAKKQQGKKLYELARQGITVDRPPALISLTTTLLHYEYPYISLHITCSKGTYIRSLANSLGALLGTGAYLKALSRTRSGSYQIDQCIPESALTDPTFDLTPHLMSTL
jgi:tRNA pseudouridine55 synthase